MLTTSQGDTNKQLHSELSVFDKFIYFTLPQLFNLVLGYAQWWMRVNKVFVL